jgi:hypothetical protein
VHVPKRLEKILLLLILGVQCCQLAHACTARPDWVEPSVLQQFEKAGQVMYGVVESLDFSSGIYTVVKLREVRSLKGPPLDGDKVQTLAGAMCGVSFQVGQEYVVFIRKDSPFVDRFDQPRKAPSETLRELSSLGVIP